ncbi:MAG: DUF1565 domain-containing protein [bacterium]|nr:DUF1565 domain-containing protein [bacterium]
MPAAQAGIVPQSSWYVATDGDDTNAGTSTQPFRTLQHAVSTAAAGDTVAVSDGVYPVPATATSAGRTGASRSAPSVAIASSASWTAAA